MALVTVGVPVYNGAEYLEKSLPCLRDQSFRDIEVLIFDNCSEDATPEIAQRFCVEDPRFRYHRQPENKGALRNFLEVLEAAQSPFFLWRAADDTSDLNYIEALLNLLLAHPDRDIAVGRVVASFPDGRVMWEHEVSPLLARDGAMGRLAQVFLSCPAWFYGLTRREAMARLWPRVLTEFPYLASSDVAALFALGFDRKIIGTSATNFYGYLRFPGPRKLLLQRSKQDEQKLERTRALTAFAQRHVDLRITNPAERWFYRLAVAYWGQKRGYSITKRLRRYLMRSFTPAQA